MEQEKNISYPVLVKIYIELFWEISDNDKKGERDMSSLEGPGGPAHTPREIRMYEQEYKQSAQLFQDAVEHYAKSDNPYQKKEFQEVMDKTLAILNETARELNRQKLFDQNEQIGKDYDSFNKTPDDEKTIAQLNKDLEQAKKSIS
jgi:hypothetical protein